MAGPDFQIGQYEFQCLHGMGEALYDEVVGHNKLNRPCRIYAPVGTHETLLAYLVRRLLENGANTSFVNRIGDASIPVEELVADPALSAASGDPVGAPDPRIALPRELFGDRLNSEGLDLSSERRLAVLSEALLASDGVAWSAEPPAPGEAPIQVRNPAARHDIVGVVRYTPADAVAGLFERAGEGARLWRETLPAQRAAILTRAGDLLEAAMLDLVGLIVRESGKILADAVGEVREAVDFLRYYAAAVADGFDKATHFPLGTVVCISPWNFPLAIFTGQIAAALAAGNAVLAKPAQETPLIAAQAVRILHEAGVPEATLQLVPGDGGIGGALTVHPDVGGVMFTGSTSVARAIQRSLAPNLRPDGHPIPLIAETGGQNAMIVDSSALAEQVVTDVVVSAFNSAGQRCSALRLLCLQDEIADRTLRMLRGAMAELRVGLPDRLSTDIGPVITDAARDAILSHVSDMRAAGHAIHGLDLPEACAGGSFVAPTLIEIARVSDLREEVFGPVLHVLRYRRDGLDALLTDLAATGYALTFGVHTRLDETIAQVTARAEAGNIYVNRNIVGAVVGVQPFGGHGLSGTGPKAGGPLILRRLLARVPSDTGLPKAVPGAAVVQLADHLEVRGRVRLAARIRVLAARSPLGTELVLAGPVGERNSYTLLPRGGVLCRAATNDGLALQLAALLATGNTAVIEDAETFREFLEDLPPALRAHWRTTGEAVALALYEGGGAALRDFCVRMACRDGAVVPVLALSSHEIETGRDYPLEFLLCERSISVNTAAAGGNASLMSIG